MLAKVAQQLHCPHARDPTHHPTFKERAVMMTMNEDTQQRDGPRRTVIDGPPPHYECSFCGKGQEEVAHLIAGPQGVYICNECVALCNHILAQEEPPAET